MQSINEAWWRRAALLRRRTTAQWRTCTTSPSGQVQAAYPPLSMCPPSFRNARIKSIGYQRIALQLRSKSPRIYSLPPMSRVVEHPTLILCHYRSARFVRSSFPQRFVNRTWLHLSARSRSCRYQERSTNAGYSFSPSASKPCLRHAAPPPPVLGVGASPALCVPSIKWLCAAWTMER